MATIHFHPACTFRRVASLMGALALAGLHYRLKGAWRARCRLALVPAQEVSDVQTR